MAFKSGAAGLPHGGGKAGIIADPGIDALRKEQLVRAFGQDEMGRSVGHPRSNGGIPLEEIGATGSGLAACAEVAQQFTERIRTVSTSTSCSRTRPSAYRSTSSSAADRSRYIWIVDELPMTVTGKIQKFRMREQAIEQLES